MRHEHFTANPARIGALEIKRAYQRHMFLSVILSSGTALILMGGLMLHAALQPAPEVTRIFRPSTGPHWTRPTPTWISRPKTANTHTSLTKPGVGVPIPMEDDQVQDDVVFATNNELASFINSISVGFGGGTENTNNVYATTPTELPVTEIPEIAEKMPIPVSVETPVYPELAERAGIEGRVWVKVLVDEQGFVRQAVIAKASGTSAGFEEAALAAAMNNRYRPALQNGRPVMVWLTYKVDFELR